MPETQKDATPASREDHHAAGWYEIRLGGHLDDRWADWFDGLTISREAGGDTLLTGPVVDQAALHGLLRKVRDLNLPLVAVTRVDSGQASGPEVNAEMEHNHSKKETSA